LNEFLAQPPDLLTTRYLPPKSNFWDQIRAFSFKLFVGEIDALAFSKLSRGSERNLDFELARVLVVDDDPTSRLTLQTVLKAGGYRVDSAASAAEAVGKLEEQEYELVLSDLQMESPEAGLKVLAHARMMDYKPATAIVTSSVTREPHADKMRMLVKPEDLPGLLAKVANLISQRAARKVAREMRHN
jgi:CheY-like chemotaxis protein